MSSIEEKYGTEETEDRSTEDHLRTILHQKGVTDVDVTAVALQLDRNNHNLHRLTPDDVVQIAQTYHRSLIVHARIDDE